MSEFEGFKINEIVMFESRVLGHHEKDWKVSRDPSNFPPYKFHEHNCHINLKQCVQNTDKVQLQIHMYLYLYSIAGRLEATLVQNSKNEFRFLLLLVCISALKRKFQVTLFLLEYKSDYVPVLYSALIHTEQMHSRRTVNKLFNCTIISRKLSKQA